MKALLFTLGFLILFLTEVARVYFIMPFPGSQQADTIDLAYFIQSHLGLLRLIGLLILVWPMLYYFRSGRRVNKIVIGSLLLVYLVVFYLFNFRFLAEKMFYQPSSTVMLAASGNKIGLRQLIVGVSINGQSKAYPIQLIGYHHQVRDVLGGKQLMVTYCTVCRTGRVYSPEVDGKEETFRLVGMDHFNAMFEDKRTRSWWRQVNGEAIAGELKGKVLDEIPSEQMSLKAWIELHPETLIMQPDPKFQEQYDGMVNYESGKSKSALTLHDSLSWKDKSWIIGVSLGISSKAFDWNDLLRNHIINDEVGGTPVAVLLENDSVSFHAWQRVAGNDTLVFQFDKMHDVIIDENTGSSWDKAGNCIEGKLRGARVMQVPAYQEYWHSWRTFHPNTGSYSVPVMKSIVRR